MKFAAAKQMALLLFFDIRVKISGSLQKNGLKEFSTTVNEDGLFLDYGEVNRDYLKHILTVF